MTETEMDYLKGMRYAYRWAAHEVAVIALDAETESELIAAKLKDLYRKLKECSTAEDTRSENLTKAHSVVSRAEGGSGHGIAGHRHTGCRGRGEADEEPDGR